MSSVVTTVTRWYIAEGGDPVLSSPAADQIITKTELQFATELIATATTTVEGKTYGPGSKYVIWGEFRSVDSNGCVSDNGTPRCVEATSPTATTPASTPVSISASATPSTDAAAGDANQADPMYFAVTSTYYDVFIAMNRTTTIQGSNGPETKLVQSSVGKPSLYNQGEQQLLGFATKLQSGSQRVSTTIFAGPVLPTLKPINNGNKTAEQAAIALGVIMLFAILGALAIFFLCRRRKRVSTSARRYSNANLSPRATKDFGLVDMKSPEVIATIPVPESAPAAIIYNYKPQPKEDEAIKSDYSRLKGRIDGHVQTFYLPSGGDVKSTSNAIRDVVGNRQDFPYQHLDGLLESARHRSAVLRSVITWIIFQRIHAAKNPSESMLPADMACTYSNLSDRRMERKVESAFLSEWRVMTTALSRSLYGEDQIRNDDLRMANIKKAVDLADRFLEPLANSTDHNARLQNLEEIMKRAARFGWTLFSQPSDFSEEWNSRHGTLCVAPALWKVSDENGQALVGSDRVRFAEMELVSLQ